MALISILMAFIARGVVIPEIAQTKSYREFMAQVNQLVKPGDTLYIYGRQFNSDPVVFYRGGPIESLDQEPKTLAAEVGAGKQFVIMSKKSWDQVQDYDRKLPPPLLRSEGKGPEGDAPLVLVQADVRQPSVVEFPNKPCSLGHSLRVSQALKSCNNDHDARRAIAAVAAVAAITRSTARAASCTVGSAVRACARCTTGR
jgi:hypothetical protein